MLTLRPLLNVLRRRFGGTVPDIAARAVERWEVSPASELDVTPVIMLPGQIERITRTEFGTFDEVMASLAGQRGEKVGPTFGYRLRDVDFVDGVLSCRGAEQHLRSRTRRTALGHLRPREHLSGALYESWIGNRWFGNWLLNDCLTYRLAEAHGQPVTSAPPPRPGGHGGRYEERLSMAPRRVGDVHFDELILFEDLQNNSGRLARAQDMRARLLAGLDPRPLPGVFLLRGASGDARLMRNETEIAERLEAEYGFRVMYPLDHSVDALAEACGGTRIVAGVEGSHLVHGVAAMAPGGTVLTLQPPDRTTTSLKLLSDRWQQRYAMIVGQGTVGGFEIGWEDVCRTLDLMDRG